MALKIDGKKITEIRICLGNIYCKGGKTLGADWQIVRAGKAKR